MCSNFLYLPHLFYSNDLRMATLILQFVIALKRYNAEIHETIEVKYESENYLNYSALYFLRKKVLIKSIFKIFQYLKYFSSFNGLLKTNLKRKSEVLSDLLQ